MSDGLIVIGLTGKARSGKDTVAKILSAHAGFTRVALADGIRSAFNDLSGPTWELHKELNDSFNARRMMQTIGTECREDIVSSTGDSSGLWLWVNLVLAKIRYARFYHPHPVQRFVVPDIRYPHEAMRLQATIHDWEGHYETWGVHRSNVLAITESDHSSEQQIDAVAADRVVSNSSHIDDLIFEVREAFHGTLGQRARERNKDGR